MLDGNAAFGTMTEAVATQSARPEATGVVPSVVVGIGYQTSELLDPVARTFDYTPDVDRAALSTRADGSEWPPTGGASAFLDFIEDELKPAIQHDFQVDRRRQVLFGHSFGGLFALFALFTRPDSFSSYIAASPSIWFGDRAILAAEREFAASLHGRARDLRLMIGVGGLEQTLSSQELEMPGGSPRVPWIEKNRMVDNAREMAQRLEGLRVDGLQVAYEELPGENHASVVPTLVGRALRFALAPAL